MLNEKEGIKVSGKGFTLVPDFGHTGFLIQGETLEADIAECGDFLANPALTEMLTSYVILSRVKQADGLLLLRASHRFYSLKDRHLDRRFC